MKYWMLVLLAACTAHETGSIDVHLCPNCTTLYDTFSTCAFFDAKPEWITNEALIDHENVEGVGIPIKQSGYMHHKFCFNDTHAVFGSANPTERGLTLNRNYGLTIESALLAQAFANEYAYLQAKQQPQSAKTWLLNTNSITAAFCPRDNCEQRLIDELQRATHTITVLTFSFTSKPVADALIDAQQRGVGVHITAEPWGASRGQLPRLEKHVSVTYDREPGLMHAKAFIIDNTISVVGSYNPTKSGTSRNAETLIILHDEDTARMLSQLAIH